MHLPPTATPLDRETLLAPTGCEGVCMFGPQLFRTLEHASGITSMTSLNLSIRFRIVRQITPTTRRREGGAPPDGSPRFASAISGRT